MALSDILVRIRGARREADLTVGESYYHLVRDVAAGTEVDADDAALVIEQSGKTDSDFERDVATMGRRMAAAERLRERKDAESQLPKAEAATATAQAKLNAAMSKLRPAVDDAAAKVRHLTQEIGFRQNAENDLVASVLNPAIVKRETELAERLLEIRSRLEPIEADYRKHAGWLAAAEGNLDVIRHSIATADDWNVPKLAGLRIDLKQAEARFESEARWCREFEKLLVPLERERNEIQRQQGVLHLQKLIP